MREPNQDPGDQLEELAYLSRLLEDNFGRGGRAGSDQPAGSGRGPSEAAAIQPGGPIEQLVAVTAGALLLLLLHERGGTRLERHALEVLARTGLDSLPDSHKARVTDEVTRIVDWLSENLAAPSAEQDTRRWGDVNYEVGPYMPILKECVRTHTDIEVEYFSYNRGQWTRRRLSPRKLEGRNILVAFCHLRGMERRFRISRIRSIKVLSRTRGGG